MFKGDSFGEQALYFNSARQCSVKAIDEVRCLALGRDVLTEILGDQVQAITFRNIQRWAFDKSPILSKLLKIQREKLVDAMNIQNVKKDEIIFSSDAEAKQLVIVIEGELKNVFFFYFYKWDKFF